MSDSDMLRRGDVLKAIHDALVVNPARDEARKLAGFVVSALPAVQPDAAVAAVLQMVREVLSGIDDTENNEGGWWETGSGAEFGAQILKDITSRAEAIAARREAQPDAAEQAIRDAMTVGIGVVRIAPEDFYKAAEAQPDARIKEYEEAYQYALHLAEALRENFPPNPDFRFLGDLVGLLTQIDNMVAGLSQPAVQPAHVNETPKSEHDTANMLAPATKGGTHD